MGPLRSLLRSDTASAHARLDGLFAGCDLTTLTGYGAFLRGQASATPGLEHALEARGIATLLPDWPERVRRTALAQDLAQLGLPAPAAPEATLPEDEAGLMGAAYVLEGSRLGGAMLLRRVLQSDDATLRAATRFLRHGAEGGLWTAYLARLEGCAAAARRTDRLLAGAHAAFTHFETAARASLRLPEGAGYVA